MLRVFARDVERGVRSASDARHVHCPPVFLDSALACHFSSSRARVAVNHLGSGVMDDSLFADLKSRSI